MQGERQPAVDRAEVYVRSLLPDGHSEQQADTLDRVAALVEDGVVGERRVRVCGRQVPAALGATRTSVGERLVTRLAAFREWARRNDCTLAPAMELRVVEDSLADARYRAVRLPALFLAEYRDGALRCVTPHHAGDAVHSVDDRLAELESGDPTAFQPVRQGPPHGPVSAVTDALDETEPDATDTPLPKR